MNRRELSLLVPCVATLLLAGCSKKDDPAAGDTKAADAAKAAGDAKTDAPADAKADAAGETPEAPKAAIECPKSLSGTENADRVIAKACGIVPVTGDYSIEGATLTLEAGAKLEFAPGTRLTVGYYEAAKLVVKGTAADPVTFTTPSKDKVSGLWKGVFLREKADGSAIEGLVLDRAGGDDEPALLVEARDVTISGSTVRGARGIGIDITGEGSAELTGNTFDHTGPIALRVTPAGIGGVGADNAFPVGSLVQVQPGAIAKSTQWAALNTPWLVAGQIQINGTPAERATVTLGEGAELRFAPEASLDVGYYAEAALIAEGSEAKPILFKGNERNEAGAWGGLRIFGKAEARFEHVRFMHGGRQEAEGTLLVEGAARVTLHEVDFLGNLVGVVVQGTEARFEVFDATRFEVTPVAMRAPARYLAAFGERNEYIGEPRIIAEADKLEADTTWKPQPGARIELEGLLQISGSRLVIDPGFSMYVADGIEVQVGYYENAGLELRGTADAPITVQGVRDEPGSWGGIVLFPKARGNVFEHVVLRNAGGQAGVRFDGESDGKVSHLRCDFCSASGLTWTCSSKVEHEQIIAGEGTPKDYEEPACN
jgi:hypothetical protein